MTGRFAKLTYTPSVLAVQQKMGSNAANRLRFSPDEVEALTEDEAAFIAERDSFYMATVNEDGWPYIQHRGGPAGFLHVLDGRTLAFADFAGNKQYITAGNLVSNDRVALFLMDYPHQARLKIIGHARIVELREDPALEAKLGQPADPAPIERIFVISVVAYDWNCSQHITPRFTEEEIARGS